VLQLLVMFVMYFSTQAALSRWVTSDIAFEGFISIGLLLYCALWGASVSRRVFPIRWRPLAGVLAFLALLVTLFMAGVAANCLVAPRCFG
jgi:hypothetical protein